MSTTTTSTPPPILKLSTRVSIAAGYGTIKFVGQTAFAPGKWIGIELDELNGKNDGSVGGKRYFNCLMGKGMFVKPNMIRVLLGEESIDDGNNDDIEREDPSPTPSQPSVPKASLSRPSSSFSASRPLSTSTSRPNSATTSTSRPSTSTSTTRPPSARPRPSSVNSTTSTGKLSPTNLLRSSSRTSSVLGTSKAGPRSSTIGGVGSKIIPTTSSRPSSSVGAIGSSRMSISGSNSSATSTSSSRPRTSMAPNLTKSSTAKTGEMLPPPIPVGRALPRPISPTKKSIPTPSPRASPAINKKILSPNLPFASPNFAPPSPSISLISGIESSPRNFTSGIGGISRPRGLSIVSNTSSSSGTGIGLGLNRLKSPTITSSTYSPKPMLGSIHKRSESSLSSRSLNLQPSPRIGLGLAFGDEGDTLEVGGEEDLILGGDESEVEEVIDRFSLRGEEKVKKVVEPTVTKREYEELLAKLRILEARRADDRERLREVDKLREESEEWDRVKEKSKAKILELSQELKSLKQTTKETMTEKEEIELKFSDLNDSIEMSLLDKEMAEEQFELAQSQLEVLKEKVAELEIEVGVLRDENLRMEGEGDDAIAKGEGLTSSLAYIQLEKQNGRLKDTLLRFRDHTSETEAEHRRRIADLEKELDLTSELQAVFDNTVVELERSEAQIEELKLQLDDALGAEDMLEDLTDKNLTLSDKLDELKAVVEDFEALQELNDELEESHLETELQLQEEIESKEFQLRESLVKINNLDESVQDYEITISQFRELVVSLQSDLEQLKEHQASQETVSQSLTSQSQAMLNLNLKLQSTVAKGQIKTIELELKKLDALQAVDQILVMKPYLLPAYFEDDSDAVDALLFFERISYKVDLINMIVEQTHNVTDSLNSIVPENLVGICETRSKLSKFSSLNKRFAAQLKRCSPDLFIKMGRVYHEVSSTEKKVDSFIDTLRKEEFRELECSRELEGLIAQGGHLAETHLQESLLDLAERELAHVAALELDFDTIAASAGFTKQALATILQDPDVILLSADEDLDADLFKPLQDLVNQARNSKVVAKKLTRRINELIASSSALSIEHLQGFETLSHNSSAIATAASKLAASMSSYCTSLRSTKEPFQLSSIISIAQEITSSEFGKSSGRPLDDIGVLLNQLGLNLATTLTSSLESEGVVVMAFTPPWIARVKDLQSSAAVNLESEKKYLKLNEDMKELVREMRTKDQSYQESSVKIELMEKRMESVKKQAEAIIELESELSKSKKQERAFEEAIEALQVDLDTMEEEINKLKIVISTSDKQGSAKNLLGTEGESISYEGNMETSRLIEQIESLRGAVRFLRSENSYLKSQDLLSELDQLPSYTLPAIPSSINLSSKPTGLPATLTSLLPTSSSVLQRTFLSESKSLLREARVLSATPKMIDLSQVRPGGKSGGWKSRSRDPITQWEVEKDRARDLGRRVERLKEMRLNSLNGLVVSGA